MIQELFQTIEDLWNFDRQLSIILHQTLREKVSRQKRNTVTCPQEV